MSGISNLEHLSDEELASQISAGSRSLFEELISRYSMRLFYFLRHRTETDQDIEDLVQETFLKAYKGIERYNPEWKFSTWLYTIATREAISRHRSNKKMKHDPVETTSIPDPEEIIIQKEESQNIWALATTLPKKEYEALWLRYAEDMSIKEIAAILKCSEGVVKNMLFRSLQRLKLILQKSQSEVYL